MSVLESRLTLARRRYAEQHRHLAELEGLAERLRSDAGRLRSEIEQSEGGAGDPVIAWPLVQRAQKLERSIADLDQQIAAARAALAVAGQELSGHERASAQRMGRQRP